MGLTALYQSSEDSAKLKSTIQSRKKFFFSPIDFQSIKKLIENGLKGERLHPI